MQNDNLNCKDWKELPPVYLNIRRETLIHLGILTLNDDPSSPKTIDKLKTSIHGYINNVMLPFVRLNDTEDTINLPIPSPCQDGLPINGSVAIVTRKVYAAGTFAPILFHATNGLLAGTQEFVGLDQIAEVFLPGQHPGENDDYYIKIILTVNGDPNHISPTGYDEVSYAPDPIGDMGTYFFRCMPAAQVIDHGIHT
ncbi:MAG: hypothetical protein ACRC3Y_05715 [Romboutsia sp.]|uniref:hypothetical protein n=1 Tax=Romboutsia sp. TaxID=1965302 RepID=UPI003F32C5D8